MADRKTGPLLVAKPPISRDVTLVLADLVLFGILSMPLPWWGTASAWVGICGVSTYLAFRSEVTYQWDDVRKIVLSAIVILGAVALGHKGVLDQYRQAHPLPTSEPTAAIKKKALDLGGILTGRATKILVYAGQHPSRESDAPPNTGAYVRQQTDRQRSIDAHQEAQVETDELLSDYRNQYIEQILNLRTQFMLQGQTDWKDVQYYTGASTPSEILMIGEELIKHANALS